MNARAGDEEEGLAYQDPRPRILASLEENHQAWQESMSCRFPTKSRSPRKRDVAGTLMRCTIR
jgi:hypothetical protein